MHLQAGSPLLAAGGRPSVKNYDFQLLAFPRGIAEKSFQSEPHRRFCGNPRAESGRGAFERDLAL
jgi:hypothetical protein